MSIRLIRKLAGWSLYFGAAIFFAVFCLLVYTGGKWSTYFYADAPYENVLLSAICFLAGYVLVKLGEHGAKDWARFAGKMVMLSLSLGVSLLIAEVGLRLVLEREAGDNSLERLEQLQKEGKELPITSETPLVEIITPVPDPELVYQLKPNLDIEFGNKRLVTNRVGIREVDQFSVAKPENVTRIIGIGDSGMFGWGVEQDESYMSVLERLLSEHTENQFEVMNTGIPGYNTAMEVTGYEKRWRKYNPDIIIVGWCKNDYYLPHFMLEKTDFRRKDVSFLQMLAFERDEFYALVYGIRMTDRNHLNVDQVVDELSSGTEIEGVKSALKDLKRMAEEDGSKLLVFGAMDVVISAICREVGVEYFNSVDEIAVVDAHEGWGVHQMHPRAQGHALLGGYLYNTLIDLGWIQGNPVDPETVAIDAAL